MTTTAVTEKGEAMSDLISRQAAIDAVERAKTARSADGEIFCAKINAQMNIQHLPSIQPERRKGEWIEVVRCKDCKYSKHLKQYPKVNTWKCTLTDVVYRADDFCSYGERREEE